MEKRKLLVIEDDPDILEDPLVRSINFAVVAAAAWSVLAGPAFAQTAERQPPGVTHTQSSTIAPEAIDDAVESVLGLTASPSKDAQESDQDPGGFRVFWSDGLHMETDDGRFQIQIGGRMQYDWIFWGDDAEVKDAVSGPLQDGTEFRRARLFVQGYLYEIVEFRAQYDFAGGDDVIKDLYFGIRHPKYGFRVGHMKEPFGLEELMSSKYITFVERALPTVFDSERNSGFLLHGNVIDSRFNYGIGIFRETDPESIGDAPSRYNVTGRFAGALLNREAGRRLFHVGGSFTFQNDSGGDRVFAARPEVHLSPRFISTGVIPTNSATVFGLETAVVAGSFSAQAEWKAVPFDSPDTGDPVFFGWYAYGSYFLTGENRNYLNSVFNRLTPNRNFLDGSGGLGAWEVAARYSMLDFGAEGVDKPEDAPVPGTRLDNMTLALNWYWNPMTLMKFNFIRSEIQDIGHIWAFLWRGQLEF